MPPERTLLAPPRSMQNASFTEAQVTGAQNRVSVLLVPHWGQVSNGQGWSGGRWWFILQALLSRPRGRKWTCIWQVFEMGKCKDEVSLGSKRTVCHVRVLKAICYEQDYCEMF